MFKKMFIVLFSTFSLLVLTACTNDVDEMRDEVDEVGEVGEVDEVDEVDDTEEEVVEVSPHHLEEVDEPLDGLQVHFIDTGQSEDILIRTAETTILMSTSLTDIPLDMESPIPYLESQLVDEIDLLISTSGLPEHHLYLPDILERFSIKELWMPPHGEARDGQGDDTLNNTLTALQEQGISPYTPLAGGTRTIGDIHLEVIYSSSDEYDPLVVKVTYGDMSYLFNYVGGAAMPRLEKDWLASDIDLRSTVLKTSSHKLGNHTEFLQAVDPKIAVNLSGEISAHPTPQLIDRIDESGIDEYGTLGHGTIVISTDGKSYHVETETKPTSVDPYYRPSSHEPRSLKSIK